MFQYKRENYLPGWLWFFLILPMVLIVALLYRRRRLSIPSLPRFGERGVQRYVEPDSIPLDMSDVLPVSIQQEPVEPLAATVEPVGTDEVEAAPEAAAQPDDLKIIEGIGPAIERHLQENGISTFRALANTPVERLVEILTVSRLNHLADPSTWAEQARLAAEGKWEDLSAFQETLKGGRRARIE